MPDPLAVEIVFDPSVAEIVAVPSVAEVSENYIHHRPVPDILHKVYMDLLQDLPSNRIVLEQHTFSDFPS